MRQLFQLANERAEQAVLVQSSPVSPASAKLEPGEVTPPLQASPVSPASSPVKKEEKDEEEEEEEKHRLRGVRAGKRAKLERDRGWGLTITKCSTCTSRCIHRDLYKIAAYIRMQALQCVYIQMQLIPCIYIQMQALLGRAACWADSHRAASL